MLSESYPHLTSLLGGYFHQDCYEFGDTDEDILREFIRSSNPEQRRGVRTDLRRFLHDHSTQLLEAIHATFTPDIIIGETDEDVRAWLLMVETALGSDGVE